MVDDRTHRKRAEAEIERLVHHDLLTSLPNRAAFTACIDATIETATREGTSFALLCLDFDRFKEVNDVYGHAAGDEMLRQLAKRLQAAVGGAFVARLGGDEFVVIATDGQQPAAAEAMVDRLLAAIKEPITVNGDAISIGLSIGAAIFPADGADSASLVANADAALDRAKAEGRGKFRFFEAGMDQRLRERRALQQELRSAIARGELILHYQPQARIDGEVFGFEALVRWQHPQRGLIPPGTFIPLAEESGLIGPLGEWIMREACREAASWPKPLQIAINLSPVEFRHGDLTGLVHSVLLETGLAPSRLELEITEGVLIDDFSRAVSTLRRLKALGVRIAMDDFGTGYSSLSYLQSFPFDKIKIDKSFISNLGQQPPVADHRARRDRARARARAAGAGRGRRDQGAARLPRQGILRRGPGLPDRPPAADRALWRPDRPAEEGARRGLSATRKDGHGTRPGAIEASDFSRGAIRQCRATSW